MAAPTQGLALWFDVGIKRYTTEYLYKEIDSSCGLM